jgi:hypothetical protein
MVITKEFNVKVRVDADGEFCKENECIYFGDHYICKLQCVFPEFIENHFKIKPGDFTCPQNAKFRRCLFCMEKFKKESK